jgi:hypothetical protein
MSLTITTNYGSIEYDDIDFDDISEEAADYFKRAKDAAELFFSDEIDLHEFDDNADIIDEIAETVIAENKFDDPMRAIALAQHTGSDLDAIDQEDDERFKEAGNEYLVLTDDEADEKALEYEKNLLEDIGIEGMDKYVYEDYIDADWFNNAMHEYNEGYAWDIKEESASSDTYVNRLHEEMVERGVMDEPEWPDEDDFTHEREEYEREEFDEEEPDENDFESDDEYAEAYSEWEDAQTEFETEQDDAYDEFEAEQDRLEEEAQEEFENATEEYRSELESDVEYNIDEFAEKLDADYDDGIEYWESNFGSEDVTRIAIDQGLIDFDGLAQYIIDSDGRGSVLNHWDGNEDEETVRFKGETETYYIYRQ